MKAAILLFAALSLTSSMAQAHPSYGQTCARVFQYDNYGGAVLTISSHERLGDLNQVGLVDPSTGSYTDWDNKISSLIVEPGCALTGYQYQNFGRDYSSNQPIGWRLTWRASPYSANGAPVLAGNVHNTISSLVCYCQY
jgi:hypothetical protein